MDIKLFFPPTQELSDYNEGMKFGLPCWFSS